MDNDYLLYLQEIPNVSWIVEVISETFDDALDLMTSSSIVYGGAIRDCLAGKKLIGDLDIIVMPSVAEYSALVNRFTKSPKWISINNRQENLSYEQPKFLTSRRDANRSISKIPYLTAFKTLGNKTVQIITPSTVKSSPFRTIVHFAKQVDIICCGLILTNESRVFEIVPDAYEDCKKGILRLNNLSNNIINFEHFQARIEKLTARGWINNINMAQAVRNIKRRQKQQEKSNHITKNDEKKQQIDRKTYYIDHETTKRIGDMETVFHYLTKIKKDHHLNVTIASSKGGFIMFTTNKQEMLLIARELSSCTQTFISIKELS